MWGIPIYRTEGLVFWSKSRGNSVLFLRKCTSNSYKYWLKRWHTLRITSMVPFLWRFRRWWVVHLLFKGKGCKQRNGNENLVAVRLQTAHQNCHADKRLLTSSILAIPACTACPLNWWLKWVCVLVLQRPLLVRFSFVLWVLYYVIWWLHQSEKPRQPPLP